MLRSAISAFTRVFDALWRCAADPPSILSSHKWVPALRSSVLDDATHRQENAAPRPDRCERTTCVQKPPRWQEIVLFPDRFIRIPALGLEYLCQRIDRAVVVLLFAFLVAAGLFGQIEFWARGFVRRRNDGTADPQQQPVGRARPVRCHQGGKLNCLGETERGVDLARPFEG